MIHVVLSIGSNINREKNIRFAVKKIIKLYGDIDVSPVYETASIGFTGRAFFNLALGFRASTPLADIRDKLRCIEAVAGRIRGKKSFDNRILDIDIILYGDKNLRPDGLNIPRDEIEKYAYVLKPLSDLYPTLRHPISGINFQQMWLNFDNGQKFQVVEFDL